MTIYVSRQPGSITCAWRIEGNIALDAMSDCDSNISDKRVSRDIEFYIIRLQTTN